jgi:hypothetical protein
MSLRRGQKHRADICAVLDAFGDSAEDLVFLGGCVVALYARSTGAPLRTTADVDCLSRRKPWSAQEKILGELCTRRVLIPDPKLQCRYRIRGTGIDVDILSPDGLNVPRNPWLERAADHARSYDVAGGRRALAVTPPYFLATKLVAFEDRGPDAQSSKDAEDIVTLAVEVPDLVDLVDREGMRGEVVELWAKALDTHRLDLSDVDDLVDWHLHREDRNRRDAAADAIRKLASGD